MTTLTTGKGTMRWMQLDPAAYQVHEWLREALAVARLESVAAGVSAIAVLVSVGLRRVAIGACEPVPETSQEARLFIGVLTVSAVIVLSKFEKQVFQSLLVRKRKYELPRHQLAGEPSCLVDLAVVVRLDGLEVTLERNQCGDHGGVMTVPGQVVDERLKRLEVLPATQVLPAQRRVDGVDNIATTGHVSKILGPPPFRYQTHSANFLDISAKLSSSSIVGTSGVSVAPRGRASEAIFDAKERCYRLLGFLLLAGYLRIDVSPSRSFARRYIPTEDPHVGCVGEQGEHGSSGPISKEYRDLCRVCRVFDRRCQLKHQRK